MPTLKKVIEDQVFDKLKKNPQFSLCVGVLHKNKMVLNASYGKSFKTYDLASMTKSIFTASAVINLYPELINKKVSQIIPWVSSSQITVKDLLTHSSGLPAHVKIYMKVKSLKSSYEKKSYLQTFLREEFKKAKVKKEAVYSDIGFLLLGEVLETYTKKPLVVIWTELKEELNYPIGFSFEAEKTKTAPTEKCSWRKKNIQGEVFDRNAYTLGGAQPHAGLFGSGSDMLLFGRFLRENYKKNKKMYKKIKNGWTTGFMVPSGEFSTAGSLFSKKSIGHLGFTGTSFWYDPEKDLYVSILSNRTYPNRDNVEFNKFRPVIHDLVYKNLVLGE